MSYLAARTPAPASGESSPGGAGVWAQIMQQLEAQQDILSDLLEASPSRDPGTPPPLRRARYPLSPSLSSVRPAPLASPDPGTHAAAAASAGPPLAAPAREPSPAAQTLLAALSTSSWSSEEPADDAPAPEGEGEALQVAAPPSVQPSPPSAYSPYVAAMRLVAAEHDRRQAVLLQEFMAFTELSSAFINSYTPSLRSVMD